MSPCGNAETRERRSSTPRVSGGMIPKFYLPHVLVRFIFNVLHFPITSFSLHVFLLADKGSDTLVCPKSVVSFVFWK